MPIDSTREVLGVRDHGIDPRGEAEVTGKPSTVILDAVTLLHARGLEGVRVRANFYATGHWRCRVYVSHRGDDPALERDVLVSYTSGRGDDLLGDGRIDWTAESLADDLEKLASVVADAGRADPDYTAWYRGMRLATGPDGVFALWDDRDHWERDGHVAVIRAFGDTRDAPDRLSVPPPP